MAKYEILFWHDIPVQVRAGTRRDRTSIQLPPRFQEAIDMAAMAAGLTGTEGYLAGFYWRETDEREGSAEETAKAVASELEAQYEEINWRETAERIKRVPKDG